MFPFKIDEQIASKTLFPPIRVYQSAFLQPDFFAISDWNNPRDSAKPEWLFMYYMDGKYFIHPSLAEKFMKESDEKHRSKYEF
jgi:hypothetical protein